MIKHPIKTKIPFLSEEEITNKTKFFLERMPQLSSPLLTRASNGWSREIKIIPVKNKTGYGRHYQVDIDPDFEAEIKENFKMYLVFINIIRKEDYVIRNAGYVTIFVLQSFYDSFHGNGKFSGEKSHISEKSDENLINMFENNRLEFHINFNTYGKILKELGYKDGDMKNNKYVMKIIEMMSNFPIYLEREIDNENNTKEDVENFFLNHKDLIHFSGMKWIYKENLDVITDLMDQKKLDNQFKIVFFERFLDKFSEKENTYYVRNLINQDKEFEELFKNSKKLLLKTFYEQFFNKTNKAVDLRNTLTKYHCVIHFNYKDLRDNLAFEDKTKITKVLYEMERSKICLVTKYDQMLTLVVPTEIPIKSEELEQYVSERFIGWVFDGVNFDEEMLKFVAEIKEKRITENFKEIDEEKNIKINNVRKKI